MTTAQTFREDPNFGKATRVRKEDLDGILSLTHLLNPDNFFVDNVNEVVAIRGRGPQAGTLFVGTSVEGDEDVMDAAIIDHDDFHTYLASVGHTTTIDVGEPNEEADFDFGAVEFVDDDEWQ